MAESNVYMVSEIRIYLTPLSWVDFILSGVSLSGDKNGHQQLNVSIL